MNSYIVPDSIMPRPIKPGGATVETIKAIMADRLYTLLPVAGNCLEDVDVVGGDWVAVDFTRRPAPPRYRSRGGGGGSDLCLCYTTFPRVLGPMVTYKEYQDVWGPWQMVGTQYKSVWEGGKLRLDCGMVAKRVFGVIVASYDQDGRLLWQRNPEEFLRELGAAPTIRGDIGPHQEVRA